MSDGDLTKSEYRQNLYDQIWEQEPRMDDRDKDQWVREELKLWEKRKAGLGE